MGNLVDKFSLLVQDGLRGVEKIDIVDSSGMVYATTAQLPSGDPNYDVWEKADRLTNIVLGGYVAGRQGQEPAGFEINNKTIIGSSSKREYAGFSKTFKDATALLKLKETIVKAYAAGLKDGPLF